MLSDGVVEINVANQRSQFEPTLDVIRMFPEIHKSTMYCYNIPVSDLSDQYDADE